jgi:hypothetical protein
VFTDEVQALEYLRRYEWDQGPSSGVSGRDGPFSHLSSLGKAASARSRRR